MPLAFALHCAYPRIDLPWLAPLALGGLFATWMTLDPRRAAGAGYLAGLVFFALDFGWFGETAGTLLGPFAFVIDLGPAAVEALAFAVVAAAVATAATRLRPWPLILASAAAFTLAEIARASGPLGVPLYGLGVPFVQTPLAPLAAFAGGYGLTFAVALLGAALGALALDGPRRAGIARVAVVVLATAAVAFGAWLAWPARTPEPPTLRVAAVQGNITQSLKWTPAALGIAVERYTALTQSARPFRPQFVLWPETVVTTDLLLDPTLASLPANAALAAEGRALRARFARLADSLHAVIAVGSIEATATGEYNDVFFYGRGAGDGDPRYRKRQLVPFAEYLPGPAWLRALPFASLVSAFASGTDATPLSSLGVAPLICWDANFTGLAHAQSAAGAQFYAVATDDAWFGRSDGPYAHAQFTQLRAIETGRWIVRAAATGISGIVAPDGRWTARSALDEPVVVTGTIGAPQPTLYSRLGPAPVTAAVALVLAAAVAFGRRRRGAVR